jgi:hypothetical protein
MFFAYQLKITFGDHQRPGAIAISKSNDFGATFNPYYFRVSYPGTCQSVFGMTPSEGNDRVGRVRCQHYPDPLYYALEYNETVGIFSILR